MGVNRNVKKFVICGLIFVFIYFFGPCCFKLNAALGRDLVLNSYDYLREVDLKRDVDVEGETDWEYMQYADIAIGVVAEKIGLLSNFRFDNGFIENVTIKDNVRQFKLDSGQGSADVMKILFPSSSGMLEVGSDFNLTAEQMAKVFGIVYMVRNSHFNLDSNFFENITRIKEMAKCYNKNNKNFPVRTVSDAKIILTEKVKELKGKKGDCESVKKINDVLCKIDMYIKLDEFFADVKKSDRQVVKNLIVGLSYMVCYQENFSFESSVERPLPIYTAERILLGYFVMKFDTEEDVASFYRTLKQEVQCEKSAKSKLEALGVIKKLHDMFSKIVPNNEVPYDGPLVSNGMANVITCDKNYGVLKVEGLKFADCADTSIRHVMNLLMYDSQSKKMRFPLEIGSISKEEVLDVVNNIQGHGMLKLKTLKERLYLYLAYQNIDKVNNGDDVTRSFWNYVVSNVTCLDKDIYDVVYVRNDQQNELSAGILNALKMYYNLAYVIRDGDGCNIAKSSIDKVIQEGKKPACEISNIESMLQDAFEQTLGLFNEDYEIKVSFGNIIKKQKFTKNPLKVEYWDFFGDAYVLVKCDGVDKFDFHIYQGLSHAFTECVFENIITLNDKDRILFENYNAAVLYEFIENQDGEYIPRDDFCVVTLNDFDRFYSTVDKIPITNVDVKVSSYMKKYVAFRVHNEIVSFLREDSAPKLVCALNRYKDIMDCIEDVCIEVDGITESMLKFSLSRIYENKNIISDRRFFSWYVFFMYDKSNFKNSAFEEEFSDKLKKYFGLKCILEREVLEESDFKIFDELLSDDFFVKYNERSLVEVSVNSSDDLFSRFLKVLDLSLVMPKECKDRFIYLLSEQAVVAQKWNKLVEILDKYEEINSEKVLLGLIRVSKFDLICKFRYRFDFNKILFIDSNGVPYTGYEYIDTFVGEEGKKVLDAFWKLKRDLVVQKEKILLNDIVGLTVDDLFQKFGQKKLIEKCVIDLDSESFSLLMKRLLHKKTIDFLNFEFLMQRMLDFGMWGKLNGVINYFPEFYIVRMFSDLNVFRVVMNGGNYDLLKTIVDILYKHNVIVEGLTVCEGGDGEVRVRKISALCYALRVLKDSTMADIMDPNRQVIESISKFNVICLVPTYEDILMYFEPYNGRSIISSIIQNCDICGIKQFFHERIFIRDWRERKLFFRRISFVSGQPYELLSFTVCCHRWDVFQELLNYVDKDDFSLEAGPNRNFDALCDLNDECGSIEMLECFKNILFTKGIMLDSLL